MSPKLIRVYPVKRRKMRTLLICLGFGIVTAGMGLGQEQTAPEDIPSAILQPRNLHYRYAHKYLPYLLFSDSAWLREKLDLDGTFFLKKLWDQYGQRFPRDERISSIGLDLSVHKIEPDMTIYLVTYPTPGRMTECYFTALVFQGDNVAYWTLEYGIDLSTNMPRTVLGAWTEDGAHHNYGDGPEPEKEAFLQAVIAAQEP